MENRNKRIGYSKTAYELFLKLYCKKKTDEKDSNTISAVKAWVTLTEEEKATFIEKFKECKMKYQNNIASRLEKIEPYMKKKPIKRLEAVNNKTCEALDNIRGSVISSGERDMPITDEDDNKDINTNNVMFESSKVLDVQEELTDTKSEHEVVEEYEVPVLSEPPPPHVRNSIDLFNVIKNKNGENDLEWSSLSRVERLRYRKAVYQLKKDYIKHYKIYLESLPSKELFKYYHRFEKNL